MSQPLLQARGISARRGKRLVLEPCDLAIGAGEIVGVYGPNGAGKSTLMQVLAGLLPPASGTIHYQGKRIGDGISLLAYHRAIAVMFQEPLLLRGSVRNNIALGMRLRGVPVAEQSRRLREWMEELKIAPLANPSRNSSALRRLGSGGITVTAGWGWVVMKRSGRSFRARRAAAAARWPSATGER